jgi:hypothetical protein
MRWCGFFALVLVASASFAADVPTYDMEFAGQRPESVQVGDRLLFHIKDFKLQGDNVVAPAAGAPEFFEQGWDVSVVTIAEGSLLQVIAVKPGSNRLEAVEFKDAAGAVVARTNPYNLDVTSAITEKDPKPKEPAPPQPPVRLGFPWWIVIFAGLLFILVVAAIIYGLMRVSRRKRPVFVPAPEPPKPEHEVALKAFALLEEEGLAAKGQFKKHYFAVSEILKRYFEGRYGFYALESTTSELLLGLEQSGRVDPNLINQVAELFRRLDPVKFSDVVPAVGEAVAVLKDARELVLKTRREVVANAV